MEYQRLLGHRSSLFLKPPKNRTASPLHRSLGIRSRALPPFTSAYITGLQIYLDGPYGAPSSHIFRAQHAVLIGTGIGVTPFASILQSIMHRYWKNCHKCPRCEHEWTAELPASVMNLKKVGLKSLTAAHKQG